MTMPNFSTLTGSLDNNPRLSQWLRILPSGIVEVRSGKVELGQGILTALAQIVAEELDVNLERVQMVAAQTGVSPDEGYTAGSVSVQLSGGALQVVSAEARAVYLAVAAKRLGVSDQSLSVNDGTITALDGRSTSYWELADDTLLDRAASGTITSKPVAQYRTVGTSMPRVDLPDLLAWRPLFVHDMSLTGMLHGRIARPPSRGADLISVDTETTLAIPDVVTVVRDGNFLGVIAAREEVALHAIEQLTAGATWREQPTLPDDDDLATFFTTASADTTVLAEFPSRPGDINRPTATGRHEAVFHRPYIAHASVGPACAVALVSDEPNIRLDVWTHSQGVYVLGRELAKAFGLLEDRVTVRHVKGAGCYGGNGADDAAMDAALLAMAVPGRPVKVVWSRAEELSWAPFGPAAVVRVAAEVDAAGDVSSWEHEIWGTSHITRPGFVPGIGLLAASHREGGREIHGGFEPPLKAGGGAARNSVPGYAFPAYRVVNHLVPTMPLRTSSLRSLGAFINVFAIESFMDELAEAASRDPIEYRLTQLKDPRGRAVIETAARLSGWTDWSPADSIGHGIGYARYKNASAYCAVVAEVEAITALRVRRLTIAVDAGLVINPDGARNQIEGGAIQATSWALKERVRFDKLNVTSDTWESYPILRFSEVPAVDVELLASNGNPSLGVGEAAQGPTAAAIANALYDALHVRVRELPLTAEHITAAMPD
jgi:nicotinate dehydrogenase subunit B